MAAQEIFEDDLAPTAADLAAYEAEVLKGRQEDATFCKGQSECTQSYGSRWTFHVRAEDRKDKVIGRCLCDESRQNGDILNITIVSDE